MARSRFASVLLLLAASSCTTGAELPPVVKATRDAPESLPGDPLPRVERTFRADTTIASYDDAHGLQVSYHTADGWVYLWYPGNEQVLAGEYKVSRADMGVQLSGRSMTDLDRLCYRYGPNTFNPVTGRVGGQWECTIGVVAALSYTERMRGDPFRLAVRRAVPFVLPKARTRLQSLWARCSDC